MPAISEYELNADHHALYTRVSVQLYATDMLYEQIVVQGSHQRNVAIAQQLQALDAKVVEAIQRENPTVVTMCLHGW
jgi:hypothetical protein